MAIKIFTLLLPSSRPIPYPHRFMQRRSAIAIGNFDGVHLGHRRLLHEARAAAGQNGIVTAIVFFPHPLAVIRPHSAPGAITTLDQRLRSLRDAGADGIDVIEPTPEFLRLEPADFLRRVVADHNPSHIVEGPDFRFGRDRAGDVALLERAGCDLGYETLIIEPIEVPLSDHALVRASSTMVRWLIVRGRVRDAAAILGGPFEVESTVVCGHRRGRKVGFPTANLAPNGCILPRDGIYAGVATLPDGSRRPAAISVGTNPTFGDRARSCEAHLLDYDGPVDHYGWPIRLAFHDWLRDQITYDGLDALMAQIGRDVARVSLLTQPLTAA